jgi:ABC-type Fe3+/spermidine/putrescine transport system ATPase subunit
MNVGTLSVERITRRFAGADRPAVDNASFTVNAGEVLALVGASGSGKTTTLRIIAGYERPDGGRIILRDVNGGTRDITTEPPQRRGFGMVFQHYALFPHMRVEENVAFGLEARRMGKKDRLARAHEALARVGLDGAGSRAVQSLSGGEQQRVALARAFVIDPPVLLLDEPLSNLDPARRQDTRDWLRRKLHELRSIAIFVTHDQEDAFAMADRMAVMREGQLLQIGTAEELYHRPKSFHVAEFVGRSTLAHAERGDGVARLTFAGVTQAAPIASEPEGIDGPASFVAVVRPESLALVPRGTPGTWPGRVESRRYAGAYYVYRVQVALDSSANHAGDAGFEIQCDDGAFAEGANVGVRLLPKPIALVAR